MVPGCQQNHIIVNEPEKSSSLRAKAYLKIGRVICIRVSIRHGILQDTHVMDLLVRGLVTEVVGKRLCLWEVYPRASF